MYAADLILVLFVVPATPADGSSYEVAKNASGTVLRFILSDSSREVVVDTNADYPCGGLRPLDDFLRSIFGFELGERLVLLFFGSPWVLGTINCVDRVADGVASVRLYLNVDYALLLFLVNGNLLRFLLINCFEVTLFLWGLYFHPLNLSSLLLNFFVKLFEIS